MHTHLSFKISQLRAKNQNMILNTLAVLLAMLFSTAMLPSLLVQYVYANQQLLQQPLILQHFYLINFVIGFGYFLIAVIGNIMRAKRIKYLEKQLDLEGWCSDQGEKEVMSELESLTEALTKKGKPAAKKKAASKKKTTKSKAKKSK